MLNCGNSKIHIQSVSNRLSVPESRVCRVVVGPLSLPARMKSTNKHVSRCTKHHSGGRNVIEGN